MITIRYLLDRPLDVLGHDEALKEFWVYQNAVPTISDTVVIYGSAFRVAGVLWMIGAPMWDEYTLSQLPSEESQEQRHGDLHTVAISLEYQRDLP